MMKSILLRKLGKFNDEVNPSKKVTVYIPTIHFSQRLQKQKVDSQFFRILGYQQKVAH